MTKAELVELLDQTSNRVAITKNPTFLFALEYLCKPRS
jgi:hypothetical protein